MEKSNQKKNKTTRNKTTRNNTSFPSHFFMRAVRCLSAAIFCVAIYTFPVMAQSAVLINPNALQQLQNTSPAEGGVQTITMRAEDFFTGISGSMSAAQLIEELKKYGPSDWSITGNNGSDCLFQDDNGSLLITFETSGSTLYVTVDGYSMDGIISRILSTNSLYAAQTASSETVTPPSTSLSPATWRLDSIGWWYDNGDGTWPANGWHWIDGNHDGISECYYFNENGYILTNTITPDFYLVNSDGAWVQDGIVQIR